MSSKLVKMFVMASVGACTTVLAWNSTGHEIIADIAYKNLPAKTREAVDQILQDHPQYDRWKSTAIDAAGSEDSDRTSLFIFVQASIWADEIRRTGSPYDHPQWHFVDYPYNPPGVNLNPRSPSPNDDVLFGLSSSARTLSDQQSVPEDRAVAIAWIAHLAGDSHQPLHSASLFSDDYPAPEGDRGGNSLFIRPDSKGIKLHSFWDGLLGSAAQAKDLVAIDHEAIALAAQHPSTEFGSVRISASVETWTHESYALAVEAAYADNALLHAHTAGEAASLPLGYSKKAKQVAEMQAAIAGYRLAHFLGEALPSN